MKYQHRLMIRSLVVISAMATMAGEALAASQGPLFPGTVVNTASTGTHAWVPPGEAVVDDNVLASSQFASGATTQVLDASNFGFSIPPGATIEGIEVHVNGLYLDAPTSPEWAAQTAKGGVPSPGFDTAPITGGLETATLGSESFLWGDTWTSADINASNFGVGVIATQTGALSDVGVDDISITVHFTPNIVLSDMGGGDWASAGSWTFGAPPTTNDIAFIVESHPVSITTMAQCWTLLVTEGLTITAGGFLDVEIPTAFSPTGVEGSSTVDNGSTILNSGSLAFTNQDLLLGLGTETGTLVNLDGSSTSVTDGDVHVGFSGTGVLIAEGGHSFSILGSLIVGQGGADQGVLIFRPIDSGGSGLVNPIICDDLDLGAESTLILDTNGYTPQIGDSWPVIGFTGGASGEFGEVLVSGPFPTGAELVVTTAKAGAIVVSVVPASVLPSTAPWGRTALLVLVIAGAMFTIQRSRRARPVTALSNDIFNG